MPGAFGKLCAQQVQAILLKSDRWVHNPAGGIIYLWGSYWSGRILGRETI
jgi:hypothetical protein